MRDYLTSRDLRRLTGQPAHVLNYAIDRHGPEPSGRVGITRIWPASAVSQILDSLAKTGHTGVRREGAAT